MRTFILALSLVGSVVSAQTVTSTSSASSSCSGTCSSGAFATSVAKSNFAPQVSTGTFAVGSGAFATSAATATTNLGTKSSTSFGNSAPVVTNIQSFTNANPVNAISSFKK